MNSVRRRSSIWDPVPHVLNHTAFLFLVYCSSLCVTSETLQHQKSHVGSYLIHVSWCMFFCPPLSGVCSSYTAVNAAAFSLLLRVTCHLPLTRFSFSCRDPPPLFSLAAEVFKEKPTLTLSSSALLWLPARLPLSSLFTNKWKVFTDLLLFLRSLYNLLKFCELSNRHLFGTLCVFLVIYKKKKKSIWRTNFLSFSPSEVLGEKNSRFNLTTQQQQNIYRIESTRAEVAHRGFN